MSNPAQRVAGRIAVAVLLVMLAAGSVFAAAATLPATAGPALAEPAETASPKPEKSPDAAEAPAADEAPDADEAPSVANLARIVERLADARITTTADELSALAAKVGVGGAIRVLRFAEASGKTPAEIVALFGSGKGWGVIVRELKLDIGPGNGFVMGKGHGNDSASKAANRAARAVAKAARAAERELRKGSSGD